MLAPCLVLGACKPTDEITDPGTVPSGDDTGDSDTSVTCEDDDNSSADATPSPGTRAPPTTTAL